MTGFRVSWWRKDLPDLQAAYQELKRVKTGRMARLKGTLEIAEANVPQAPPPALQEKVNATARAMRKAGASEADVADFLKGQETLPSTELRAELS